MGKSKCPDCPKCLPGWLVQFGDLMSLLLTFFILLLSMAVMDKQKVEEYFQIMKKSMGFLEQNADVREQTDKLSDKTSESESRDMDNSSSTENAAENVEELVKELNDSNIQTEQIEIEKTQNEFTLDIPSTLMFQEGEYLITNPDAKRFISKIARVIRTMPQSFNIEIIGHTAKGSFSRTSIPRDNWDLSALRSISVVKELIKNRIDPATLKVAAHSSYRPKSDYADENRRVEMRFYADTSQNDILEEENFFDRLE